MRSVIVFLLTFLIGCGSTPYRDDYTKHVNLISHQYLSASSFNYSFSNGFNVDLRGLYSENDSVTASPILYQGGAGLVGLLVQVGTHSSLIDSQRNDKLNSLQVAADQKISPLIGIVENISLDELIKNEQLASLNSQHPDFNTVFIKPIFFSNEEMTEISLRTIFWIPISEQKKNRKNKFKYQNMVQVYANKLTDLQQEKIINGDEIAIKPILASLLNTSLTIIKNELTGQYKNISNAPQTFVFKDNNNSKVVRGTLIAQKCDYKIIKDLHSWFYVYPNEKMTEKNTPEITNQC